MYQAISEVPHYYCKHKQYCNEKCKYSYFRDTLYNIIKMIKSSSVKHKILHIDSQGNKECADKYIREEIEDMEKYITELRIYLNNSE